MLYEMFARELPFRNMDNAMIILFQVGKGFVKFQSQLQDMPSETPEWIKEEIQSCTEFDRKNRPTFKELVANLNEHIQRMPRLSRTKSDPDLGL